MRDRLEPVCRRRRLDPLALCHRLGSGFTRSIDGACWRTVAGDGRHTRVQKLPEIRISVSDMPSSARGKIRIGREVAEQMLVVAERLQEPEPLAYAHNLMGNTLFWLAELGTPRMHLEKGIALYQPKWPSAGASH